VNEGARVRPSTDELAVATVALLFGVRCDLPTSEVLVDEAFNATGF
jgi:hypothetical protein